MNWYLVYTKPRQEARALINLEKQGYVCYLPMLSVERLRKGELKVDEEPLFPRYLFVNLDPERSFITIRSTIGVTSMVTFGSEPARVDEKLIEALRTLSDSACKEPMQLFTPGEPVEIIDGIFAGVEAIYRQRDGKRRIMVLIELLNRPVELYVDPANIRKITGA